MFVIPNDPQILDKTVIDRYFADFSQVFVQK